MAIRFVPIITEKDRRKAHGWIDHAPVGTKIAFRRPDGRSIDQNALMWARLGQISRQVDWYGEKLSPEDWKTVFSAALRKARVVPGLDGGFVVLGLSTSQMTKAEMGMLLDLIDAFAAERGVTFRNEDVAA